MKIIFCLLIIFASSYSFSQVKISEALRNKLAEKSKFHDVKNTVLEHYESELSKLTTRDSFQRKSIMRQLKMWNREFWINEYYTDKNDEVRPQVKVILDAWADRERNKPRITSRNQQEGWVFNGPYDCDNGIGRMDRLAFHPSNPDIIFAGSPHGGLFKSVNGGNNWEPISEYVASLGVAGIAIHPTNPDIIYTLSGDGDSNGGDFDGGFKLKIGEYMSASNGIYKTINGGTSWKKVTEFPNLKDSIYQGRKLLIDNTNPNILIAATSKGLFVTKNSGVSWDSLYFNKNIWDISFKPNDNNILYLIQDNIFRKVNVTNLTEIDSFKVIDANRISIGTTLANPSKIVLACGPKFTSNVFMSTTSGSVFNLIYQDTLLYINQIGNPAISDQTDYDNCILVDPNNENIIYIGGLCVKKSIDGGQTWNQISAYWPSDDPYMHPDIHQIAINPLNNKFYVANDGGVYEYFDGEWLSKFKGLSTTMFYHFEEENDEDDTWGGAQDNGILERNGDGLDFEYYASGDGYDVMTDHPSRSSSGNSENVYFTINKDIKKDCGVGFNDICDISVPNNINFFGNLAMHPEDNDLIYVGYQTHVYKSFDSGDNWDTIGTVPGNWAICAGKNHPNRLYISGERGNLLGIWRTDDLLTWTPINSNLSSIHYDSTKISDIEINKNNDDIVYITCAGLIDSSKVYMSTNAGNEWINISYNLPNVPIFCILRDSFDGLYIGTSIGVYYKQAANDFWEPFYNGLPAVPITQLVFEEEGSIFVHCSTFGRGLWRTLKYKNDCQENLTLSGAPQGNNYWEVSNTIISTQSIKGPGANIIYSAGNKITLTNGMKVESGAKFHGFSKPCGSQIDLPSVKSKNH